jgi:hypothetical protein
VAWEYSALVQFGLLGRRPIGLKRLRDSTGKLHGYSEPRSDSK